MLQVPKSSSLSPSFLSQAGTLACQCSRQRSLLLPKREPDCLFPTSLSVPCPVHACLQKGKKQETEHAPSPPSPVYHFPFKKEEIEKCAAASSCLSVPVPGGIGSRQGQVWCGECHLNREVWQQKRRFCFVLGQPGRLRGRSEVVSAVPALPPPLSRAGHAPPVKASCLPEAHCFFFLPAMSVPALFPCACTGMHGKCSAVQELELSACSSPSFPVGKVWGRGEWRKQKEPVLPACLMSFFLSLPSHVRGMPAKVPSLSIDDGHG